MRPTASLSISLALLAGATASQRISETAPERSVRPGQRPGTLCYNVALSGRSFDLSELAAANRQLRPVHEIDRLVASYEARVRQDQAPFVAAVTRLGGVVTEQLWLVEFATIEIAPAAVASVAALPGVVRVTPDAILAVDGNVSTGIALPQLSRATNANNHNADYVQQVLGLRGTGFSVAILAGGIDEDMAGLGRPHRVFFRGNNPADTSGGGLGGSLIRASHPLTAMPSDDTVGSGTAMASIIAGNGWGGAGADLGHGYDAFFVNYSLCDSINPCATTESRIALGLQTATAHRVRYNLAAVHVGFRGSANPLLPDQQAADQCALVGDLIVSSTFGTRGGGQDHSYVNGTLVGVAQTDNKQLSGLSATGPTVRDPLRTAPDLIANGESILTALRDSESGSQSSNSASAAAQVLGAALLVKAARPATNGREMKAILLAHAEKLPGFIPNAQGMGYLRDDWAVDNVRVPGRVLSGAIASTTTPAIHDITVTQGTPVNIALTWFRHVMTSTAYSNLALKVYDGATLVAQSDTPRNSYEVVRFTAPISGNLRIEVSAASLEVPSVPYALATNSGLFGSASHYSFYGAGCAGSRGIPTLVVSSTPILGATFELGVAHGRAQSVAGLWFGISDTAYGSLVLPYSFGALAPNCTLLASPDLVLTLPTDAVGGASAALVIPNEPSLLGSTVFNQALVFDAVNPLSIALTQGGRLTFGSF